MFYDEQQAIKACEEEPSLIFELIKEEYYDVVDKLLTRKNIDINTCDEKGNNILMKLLKKSKYEIVLKHMKNQTWDINHQNTDGDTFAHILVMHDYVNVVDIITQLIKNQTFMPNIKNNKQETILDKSINDNYIYTTVKILEDKRFNNIDVFSFKHLFNTYIKTSRYGKYTKLNYLELIIDNLDNKELMPRMEKLLNNIKNNFDSIKQEVLNNSTKQIDGMIKLVLESNV